MHGHKILVTGAAQGIGRAVALAALAAGADVYAVDIQAGPLDELRAVAGDDLHTEAFDLRSTAEIPAMCSRAQDALGGLSSMIHVAGVIVRRKHIAEVTEEDFDLQYEVNLKASFFLARSAAGLMTSGGSIVLYTSQGWWTGGYGGSIPYAATKGGVVSMTRGLARTFAPQGVRINAVAPGAVDTAMMHEGLSDGDREAFVDQIPLGRMASAEELAAATLFLVRKESAYMTGTTLNVSGGQLIY